MKMPQMDMPPKKEEENRIETSNIEKIVGIEKATFLKKITDWANSDEKINALFETSIDKVKLDNNKYKECIDYYYRTLEILHEIDNSIENKKDLSHVYDELDSASESLLYDLFSTKKSIDVFIGSFDFNHKYATKIVYFWSLLCGTYDDHDGCIDSDAIGFLFGSVPSTQRINFSMVPYLKNKLIDLVKNPQTPFFFSEYLKKICSSNQYIGTFGMDVKPQEIAPHVYMDETGLLIQESNSYENISLILNLIKDIDFFSHAKDFELNNPETKNRLLNFKKDSKIILELSSQRLKKLIMNSNSNDNMFYSYWEKNLVEINKKLNDENISLKSFIYMLGDILHDELGHCFREIKKEDVSFLNKNLENIDIKEFSFFNQKDFREGIEKKIDYKLETLSLVEQFHLLSFLKRITNIESEKVFNFSKKFKQSGFRTFLSIEHGGPEMGDKILDLGGKLPEDVASKIFEKYGKIIDTALSARETIEKLVPKEQYQASLGILGKIEESLFVRAKNLLINFSENQNTNIADIYESLNRHNESILLFADTYKAFVDSGEKIDLETVLLTSIKVLSKQDKMDIGENLWQITKENRKKFITTEDEMKKREERFKETLKDENVDFYVLEHDDHIVAFCSFENQPDGTILAESLNVETEIKGAKVGGEFFKVLVEKVRKRGDIVGYVHSGNANTLPFYESIGFKKEKVEKDGQEFWRIILPKK